MAQKPRVGLVANPRKPGAGELLGNLLRALADRGVRTTVERETGRLIGRKGGHSLLEVAEKSDVLVTLGGDGTLLWVVGKLGPAVKPIVAVNVGTLGFLTSATAEDCDTLVEAIATRKLVRDDRTMIEAEVTVGRARPKVFHGLNEVTIIRASASRVIHLETRVDGEFVNHYTGDGIILSTPTGSTAYSLSAGGPIIEPGTAVFVMTPICPHALANRAIVFSDRRTIDLLIPKQRDPLEILVDGQPAVGIDRAARVTIRRAKVPLPLLHLPETSFYAVLRQKLGWYGSAIADLNGWLEAEAKNGTSSERPRRRTNG
ncbi:MAG: NAD(+)/NADH kinase [Verrucomicrobiae bacterium]|nr:NAD(+)/NADH kinase [Verrucomicrobiae bacterium]